MLARFVVRFLLSSLSIEPRPWKDTDRSTSMLGIALFDTFLPT